MLQFARVNRRSTAMKRVCMGPISNNTQHHTRSTLTSVIGITLLAVQDILQRFPQRAETERVSTTH